MRDVIEYLVCDNLATLIYTIDLGCIDINPWTARTSSPSNPDYVVIDLDPSDDDFQKAVAAAQIIKTFLDKHKITGLAKTSGKSGMHIFLPCRGLTNQQARTIGERICAEVHGLATDFTTTNVSKEQRGTRLYLDANQNDYADTVAAPYSVRPYKHPWVSTPLQWNEIKPGLDPSKFDMHSIQRRLKLKKDLFAPTLDEKVGLQNTVRLKYFL